MIAGVAAAMAISFIATCVGSLYYCDKPKEYLRKVSAKICDDISVECTDCNKEKFCAPKGNRRGKDPKNVPLATVNEQPDEASEKFINERENRKTFTSTEWKRRTIFPSKGANVVPVRPPRRRREISRTTEDSSIESRPSSRKNASTNDGYGVKTVKAQIEFYPREITFPSKEIRNSSKSKSLMRVGDSRTEESTLKASEERSVVTSLDTKNDSSEKVKTRKTSNTIVQCENDESKVVQQLSTFQYPSCADRSKMFQTNRMINPSTSTKISSHAHELKEYDSEQIASIQEIWKRSSCNTEEYSITILREVLSFLSHEEKDCALELSTNRSRDDEEEDCNASRNDDSKMITIKIRKYHRMNGHLRDKANSSESRLMKMYGKLSGRLETNDKERSRSSKEPSKTRLSSIDSTFSVPYSDKSSYYTIRLSEIDEAIFEKNRKKEKNKKEDKSMKLSKIFQCQKCV